ncbi:MAG: hypothetical protein CMD26_03590 [Flavobacteriales bacterium]|nr:hypothetical protein [Flavobacteriales bacterium]
MHIFYMNFYLHDIYTLSLFLSTIFFSTIFFIDTKRILLLIELFINQRYNITYHRNTPLLYLFFTFLNTLFICSIVLSLFIFTNNGNSMTFYTVFKISCCLTLLFSFRLIITRVIGNLFDIDDYAKRYCDQYETSLFLLSLIFLPFILFTSYYNEGELILNGSIYIFYLFALCYLLLKIILLKRLNLFKINFMFYNILYLCGLEVLPYIGFFKLLTLLH